MHTNCGKSRQDTETARKYCNRVDRPQQNVVAGEWRSRPYDRIFLASTGLFVPLLESDSVSFNAGHWSGLEQYYCGSTDKPASDNAVIISVIYIVW